MSLESVSGVAGGEGAGSGIADVRRRCGPRPSPGTRVAASACLRRPGGLRAGEVGSQAVKLQSSV